MRPRVQTIFGWFAAAIGMVGAFVAGLFIYMNATATPLHPDANAVPSTIRSTPAPKWTRSVEQARQIARTALTRQNLPGLSVAAGSGGEIVWAEGFGYADLERRISVTPDSLFRIGDVSIPLTSAAAGLLVQERRLNLDADIQTYVPAFPQKHWPVTVRQLMGHMGGIASDEGDEERLLEHCEKPVDGMKRFAGIPLGFEPGTRFHMTTYGWILVSAAVEAAAEEPFFAFMRTHIFAPAGMAATRPEAWQEEIPARTIFYYPRFAGDPRYGPDVVREGDQSCFAGAGAFLSTPSDLVRFGFAVRNGTLLQPDTIDMLQTPQLLASKADTGYGLGWTLETLDLAGKPERMAGHGTKKDFMGGTTSLMTFPDRGFVVAVTSNISFADTRSIALNIARVFAQEGR